MTTGKDKTQTTTTNPYAPAQPSIQGIIGAADNWYNGDKGMQASMNAYTRKAMDLTRAQAVQPVQGLAEATAYNKNLIANGGWTDEMRGVANNLGQFTTGNGLTAGQSQTAGYLDPFASGQYQEDPRLAAAIAEREKRAMNGAATQFGGGRYGSASIGQGMGTAMANAGNDMMLQSNENSRNRQLQASGMLSSLYGQGAAQNLQANGLLGNMSEGARGAAMQSSGMIPMLDNQRYAGAERMAGVGDYYQSRRQGRQDIPLDRLNSYAGVIGQMGGMGGTVSKPKPGSSAQSALGGAMVGAKAGSAFGPWGTAIGAVGGGVLGYESY